MPEKEYVLGNKTKDLLAYSFGVMSMKHFIQLTGTKMIIGTVFLVIVMFPYWKLIGIF